ncbi:uncharacterized protein LOC128231650 [Mya arenaria]|uniref:uncharacterized protein LOC128231650 n=1 Tax=Mya arenaria TaxID=6604 RepID=UPI0022E04F90|nr:uncharacterized protein LOC128231650 [Mya arenaria]
MAKIKVTKRNQTAQKPPAKTTRTKRYKVTTGQKAVSRRSDPTRKASTTTTQVNIRENVYSTYKKKLVKGWKPLEKSLKEHLDHLIDSTVKLVKSRSQFSRNDNVHRKMNDVGRLLNAELAKLKVPRSNYGSVRSLHKTVGELESMVGRHGEQQQELKAAIRQEERKLEALEEVSDSTNKLKLCIQVPSNKLHLPSLPGLHTSLQQQENTG